MSLHPSPPLLSPPGEHRKANNHAPAPKTRITTKYALKKARAPPSEDAAPRPPRGNLILKTYDPVSGATLKYKTTKAQEVNRLIQVTGRLGRGMAGVAGAREALGEAVAPVDKAEEPAGEAGDVKKEEGKKGAQGAKKKKKGRK